MKMRNKITSLLSVAAVLVVMLAVAALATGQLNQPQPDVLSPGQPQYTTAPPEMDENTDPEIAAVYYTPNGVYYHNDAHCSGMLGAAAHDPGDAIAAGKQACPVCVTETIILDTHFIDLVKQADPKASDAEDFHVYTAADGNSAWVFCRSQTGVYHEGTFWHVRDSKATKLVESSQVWHWFYHEDVFPGVFVYSIGNGDDRRAYAAILKDGQPYVLENANAFANLHASYGRLYGIISQNYDYCFLEIADDQLRTVEALPLTKEDFLKMDGSTEVMDAAVLLDPSYELKSCLQRPNGVITLNFFSNTRGEMDHCYIYTTENGFAYDHGWENEIVMLPGEGSPGGMRYVRS